MARGVSKFSQRYAFGGRIHEPETPMNGKRILIRDVVSGGLRPVLVGHRPSRAVAAPIEGLVVEHFDLPSGETLPGRMVTHTLGLTLGRPRRVEWWQDGRYREKQFLPGEFCLNPVGSEVACRWSMPSEILLIGLAPDLLMQAAAELVDPDRVALRQQPHRHDSQITHLLKTLAGEAHSPGLASHLYVDSLVNLLAVELIRRYSSATALSERPTGGLSIIQLRRVIDYLHSHLAEPVRLADLATLTGMSPFHFGRQFRRSAGLSPHRYLSVLRIERACGLLARSELSVLQVAEQVGLHSQSHFARLFRRALHCSPIEYRQEHLGQDRGESARSGDTSGDTPV